MIINKYKKLFGWVLVLIAWFLIYKFIDKQSMIEVVNRSLPSKEAGLLNGMVLGETGNFSKGFYNLLAASGIIHLVVVSGSNIMLLAKIVIENLAKLITRRKAIVAGMGLMWGYVGLVGWQIPAIRAALLISIHYLAQFLGRRYSWQRSLILTILIMFMADRKILTEISFWLSFSAFLAITLNSGRENKGMLATIGETLWVSLWITPILAISFGKINLIGFLTNALVIGLVETITLIGGLGIILRSKIIIISIYPLLKYLTTLVESLGEVVWANLNCHFNFFILIGWYILLGIIVWRSLIT